MKRICVYGKGGIGKSTAVSNLAAAMAQAGKRVAVVGCDPKADSTRGLMGRRIPTVLDQLKTGASGEIAFTDSRGVRCIEAGGPEPGTGCAGRGIIVAMEEIRSRGLLDDRDVVLYDVLGDVVCGGFSMPLREQVADEVYLVTTSDFMTADWARIPYDVLDKISTRIVNEVKGINRIVYDITSSPRHHRVGMSF